MQKSVIRIGIVFGIVLLFVGVGIQPALAELSIDSDESKLVEFTVQVGDSEHTVVLSSTQAKELDNLIDNTKLLLNMATTIEETSRIFDETVVSLYDLGVLPKDMSIREAQRLVNGHHRFSRMDNVLDGLSDSNLELLDKDENLYCLVAGETSWTDFFPLTYRILFKMQELPNENIWILALFFIFLLLPLLPLWWLSPVVFGNIVALGTPTMWGLTSRGWVRTIGLNGIKNWNGSFKGNIPFPYPFGDGICCGIRGFNGISIYNNLAHKDCFYLGSALQVKIRYYNHSFNPGKTEINLGTNC